MAITAEDLKKLSPRMKAAFVLIACLLVAYFYYVFYLQSALEKKGILENKLSDMQQEIVEKKKIADKKDKYIADLKRLRETFKVALTKLPEKKEIPGLFESVSLAGRNSGIDFLLFEPMPVIEPVGSENIDGKLKPENEKFYIDIPISVKVSGSFQNTMEFFDKVSKFPRIINIENLALGQEDRNAKKGKENEVITTCVIKTYMFLDKEKSMNSSDKGSEDAQAKK
jgi:type IV pilus assembly protein PilO